MDTLPIPAQTLENYYHINGAQLERHYKDHLSDYHSWEQLSHAEDWLLFPQNIGAQLSIDETTLSDGELYTIVTHKATKGRKGAIVAIKLFAYGHLKDAINMETEAKEQANLACEKYIPELLENGDSLKQLLARSRYLLFKSADKWTDKQKQRAKLLFELYPDIKKGYSLRMIFSKNTIKDVAHLSLARWYNQVAESGFNFQHNLSYCL